MQKGSVTFDSVFKSTAHSFPSIRLSVFEIESWRILFIKSLWVFLFLKNELGRLTSKQPTMSKNILLFLFLPFTQNTISKEKKVVLIGTIIGLERELRENYPDIKVRMINE